MTTWANAGEGIHAGVTCDSKGWNTPLFLTNKSDDMQRLDTYTRFPSGMREYLEAYGWHFSRKMCEWAVKGMKTKDEAGKPKKLEAMKKDEVEELLKKHSITLENDKGYDCVYVANMAKSDFMKSAIADEAHLALFVKDYIDDPDGYEGMPFTRFYADCIGKGMPIDWEMML